MFQICLRATFKEFLILIFTFPVGVRENMTWRQFYKLDLHNWIVTWSSPLLKTVNLSPELKLKNVCWKIGVSLLQFKYYTRSSYWCYWWFFFHLNKNGFVYKLKLNKFSPKPMLHKNRRSCLNKFTTHYSIHEFHVQVVVIW